MKNLSFISFCAWQMFTHVGRSFAFSPRIQPSFNPQRNSTRHVKFNSLKANK